jgi:hypothetical protein
LVRKEAALSVKKFEKEEVPDFIQAEVSDKNAHKSDEKIDRAVVYMDQTNKI